MPGRAFAQRFAYAILACAAITLMIISQAEPRLAEQLRVGITDAVAPIFDFFSRPAETIAGGVDELQGIMAVHERNQVLEADNDRLRRWQAVAEQLSYENEMFRRLLNVVPDQRARFISARVIADSGGPFVHLVMVNAGQAHGVRKGQAVVNHDGLVGRVQEAGKHTARVLLLTDLNSRIPVVLEESRERTILRGDNSPQPYLAFLATGARVKPGDRLVTSGEGGMFPPALDGRHRLRGRQGPRHGAALRGLGAARLRDDPRLRGAGRLPRDAPRRAHREPAVMGDWLHQTERWLRGLIPGDGHGDAGLRRRAALAAAGLRRGHAGPSR